MHLEDISTNEFSWRKSVIFFNVSAQNHAMCFSRIFKLKLNASPYYLWPLDKSTYMNSLLKTSKHTFKCTVHHFHLWLAFEYTHTPQLFSVVFIVISSVGIKSCAILTPYAPKLLFFFSWPSNTIIWDECWNAAAIGVERVMSSSLSLV